MRSRARCAGRIVGLIVLLIPSIASAQSQIAVSARLSNISVNAALGAAVGIARALHEDKSVVRGLTLGVLGGAAMGVGKQITASTSRATAWVGRPVSLLGISALRSAALDTATYSISLAALTLDYRPHAARHVRASVDLAELGWTIREAVRPGNRFDVGASLESGTPVFQSSSAERGVKGSELLRIISVATSVSSAERALILRHERVHVLQDDALKLLIGEPLERAILDGLRNGLCSDRCVHQPFGFIDLKIGLTSPAIWGVLEQPIWYDTRPWEQEAYFFTEGPQWRNQKHPAK